MSKQTKAPFITVEGIDGSGKSTQLDAIRNFLIERGYDVYTTKEPGGTKVADDLRQLIKTKEVSPETELLLAFTARSDHLDKVILPKINNNICVVSDRFTDSSYAYQGGGRQIDKQHIEYLEQFVQNNIKPDAVFYFAIDHTTSQNRKNQRDNHDRLDLEKQDFFDRVLNSYKERQQDPDNNYITIDATQDLETVKTQTLEKLETFIKQWELKQKNQLGKKFNFKI